MEVNVRNRMWKGSEAGEYKEIKLFVFLSLDCLFPNRITPQKLTGFLLLTLVLVFLMDDSISLSSEALHTDSSLPRCYAVPTAKWLQMFRTILLPSSTESSSAMLLFTSERGTLSVKALKLQPQRCENFRFRIRVFGVPEMKNMPPLLWSHSEQSEAVAMSRETEHCLSHSRPSRLRPSQ